MTGSLPWPQERGEVVGERCHPQIQRAPGNPALNLGPKQQEKADGSQVRSPGREQRAAGGGWFALAVGSPSPSAGALSGEGDPGAPLAPCS